MVSSAYHSAYDRASCGKEPAQAPRSLEFCPDIVESFRPSVERSASFADGEDHVRE